MKRTLNLSASVLALVVSGAVHAQTDTTDTSSKAPATTQSGGIETVVVTAERRSEDLMKAPISADVFSGGDLVNKGVLKVDDLQFVSPSVTVNNFGQGIDFNIRGIGKGEHNTQTLTGVITYRDGVATFPGYVAEEPYYDIQSVQILRGPQGTFVGQNATGGAVFVASNDPVIGGGYDGYVMASIGNYTDGQLQGAVNIPVTDTFALRIAGFGEARGSFYSITDNDPVDNCPGGKYAGCKPGYNPGDMRWAAGRISALWKPTESLTVSFKYDADYLDNGAYPSSPNYEGYKDLPYGSGNPNPYYSDIFHVTANTAMQGIDRFTRGILKVDYVLPGGTTLRSISGYQYASTIYKTDLDGTDYGALNYTPPYPKNWTFFDHVDETIYSQEINLISPDTDRFTWILGAFGQHDLYNFPPGQFYTGVPHGVLDSTLVGKNAQIAFAGFGQVGYKVTDNLQLQFGARYSYNRTTNKGVWNQYGSVIDMHDFAKFYSFTYKGSINWQVDENNFLYAFVSTGYKPGGLNPPIYTYYQPVPFDQEKVTEYETGWKATLLDGHLRTTVDGYYNRYRNFIVTVAYPLNALPISGFLSEVNVPSETKVYGLEAEADAVFGKLTLGAGLGLQHSALGTFFAVDSRTPSALGGVCDPATGPANPFYNCVDLSGKPLTYAPSVSFNLSAQYQFDLDGGDTLTPRANFGHQSGQWATLFDVPALGDKLSPRDILGAQLEWVHDDYVITAYGTNLTNQHYEAALGYPLRFAGAPRQFGIRIMKVF